MVKGMTASVIHCCVGVSRCRLQRPRNRGRSLRHSLQSAVPSDDDPGSAEPSAPAASASARTIGSLRQELSEVLALLSTVLQLTDEASLEAELAVADDLASAPDFWSDTELANRVTQRAASLRGQLERLGRWRHLVGDARAALELLAEAGQGGDGGELAAEASALLAALREELTAAYRQKGLQMLLAQLEEGAHYRVEGGQVLLTAAGCAAAGAAGLLSASSCHHSWECIRDRVHNRGDGKGKYQNYWCRRCGSFQRRFL